MIISIVILFNLHLEKIFVIIVTRRHMDTTRA